MIATQPTLEIWAQVNAVIDWPGPAVIAIVLVWAMYTIFWIQAAMAQREAELARVTPSSIERLEHELGIAGHEANCRRCAYGGPVLGLGEFVIPPKMVQEYGTKMLRHAIEQHKTNG